jgi:tungstate transport system substrate-binding protein
MTMRFGRRVRAGLLTALAIVLAACGRAPDRPEPGRVLLVATHTIEDSGLLDSLLVHFRAAEPDYALQLTVASTGEALEMGRRGDVDVLFTHSPPDEEAFVADAHGFDRREVMYNDFVLLGPPSDPGGARDDDDVARAFAAVAASGVGFVSRADDSGTSIREHAIWSDAGIEPVAPWYIEAGVGMADALHIASERGAYVLSDRGTWLFTRTTLDLDVISEGDPRLLNQYAVTRVRAAANPEGARRFIDWITGTDGQGVIGRYGREITGEPLFVPNAGRTVAPDSVGTSSGS